MPRPPDDVVEPNFILEHQLEAAELLPFGGSDLSTVRQRHVLEQL